MEGAGAVVAEAVVAGVAAVVDLVVEERPVTGKQKVQSKADGFAAHFLTHDQVMKITQAVVSAEKGTRGEIVPMIVQRSTPIGHLPLYSTVIVFSLFLLVLLEWQPWWLLIGWGLPLVAALLIALVAGFLLARWPVLQRALIPAHDQESQVWQRAHCEWAMSKIQKTQERTGILIFVSVMERKAIVLADDGVAKFYNEDTWKEVVQILGQHLSKNQWTEGFQKAIARCGEILKKHLPSGATNPNELDDAPIIKS